MSRTSRANAWRPSRSSPQRGLGLPLEQKLTSFIHRSTSVLLEVQPRSGASLDGTISHHFAVSPLKRSAPSASRAGSSLPEKRARPSEPVVTPPRKKKAQPARPFAHPSTYAHLSPLTDHITLNNDVLLVGINPGVSSALHGHAYAGSTNRFWKIVSSLSDPPIHLSSLTLTGSPSCTLQASLLPCSPTRRTRPSRRASTSASPTSSRARRSRLPSCRRRPTCEGRSEIWSRR